MRTGRLTGSPACRRPPPPSSRSRISNVTPYTAAQRGAARRPPGHGVGKQCRENYVAYLRGRPEYGRNGPRRRGPPSRRTMRRPRAWRCRRTGPADVTHRGRAAGCAPGGGAGLERGLDELRGLRVDDDVPAEQHAADHLPGVRRRVARAGGGGEGTGGIGLGHTRDCRRNGPGPAAGRAAFATPFTTITGHRGCHRIARR